MKIHFIAIGGAIMHNLALCLKEMGHSVSGSDDIIFDPAKGNLEKAGILPSKIGFYEENITTDIDIVILGMHAKKDNIELKQAQALGLKIMSFPEYIYEASKDKKRVVVAGSHGKTSTTAMIMHVLKEKNVDFDYLVGSSLEGFDLSVKISHAPLIILEGDEYLSSPIDMTSKFHFYKPDVAIITGIAWDHVNVFPTWESYVNTFAEFIKNMHKDSTAFLFDEDDTLHQIADNAHCHIRFYDEVPYTISNNETYIDFKDHKFHLQIFGKHNMQNMEAARLVCLELGIQAVDFYTAMESFKGTAKRLEKIENSKNQIAFRDFAHSPSKLKATLKSVKEQYSNKKVVAVMELHTYSSTDTAFLYEYKDTMYPADKAIIYMSAKAFEIKGKEKIGMETIHKAFNQSSIEVCYTPIDLYDALCKAKEDNTVYLFMSSGNFDGFDLKEFLEA